MTKDIGIVLLPNYECRNFALKLTAKIENQLPNYIKLPSNPHITLLHVANQDELKQEFLINEFKKFYEQMSPIKIDLPIDAINATGGSKESGYKWLDLQFKTSTELAILRELVLDKFCLMHNGVLTRMHDDMDSFTQEQHKQIEKCGVVTNPFKPHITLWYINLPNENKTTKLQEIAYAFSNEIEDINCYAESIALVELGRNGNALEIIEQYSLINENHNDL